MLTRSTPPAPSILPNPLPCPPKIARVIVLPDQRVRLPHLHTLIHYLARHGAIPSILTQRRLGHCLGNHQSDAAYSLDSPRFTISTVTPSPGRYLLSHRPPPHHHDGPKVSVVPWFISTAGHSDFSHGITDDFTSRLIRPATQPRRAGPYETSRGNARTFPPRRPHTPCCAQVPQVLPSPP